MSETKTSVLTMFPKQSHAVHVDIAVSAPIYFCVPQTPPAGANNFMKSLGPLDIITIDRLEMNTTHHCLVDLLF